MQLNFANFVLFYFAR